MRDLAAARNQIQRVLRNPKPGEHPSFEAFASGSLVSAWNRLVAGQNDDLLLATGGLTELHIRSYRSAPLTAREQAVVQDRFSRAIAWIGQSMLRPNDSPRSLQPAYYSEVPVYTRPTAEGAVVLVPKAETTLPQFTMERSLTERAMARLANVLPASSDDATLSARVLGLRSPEIRAIKEVAGAVRPLSGVDVELRGADEAVHATMTVDQARDLDDFLADLVEIARPMPGLHAQLDGVRFSRQMIFLNLDNGRELEALVDASLIDRVRALLDQHVVATVEEVRQRRPDGSLTHATYRLTEVDAAPGLFG